MAPAAIMANALQKHQKQLLSEWVRNLQTDASDGRKVRISAQELSTQADEFLQLLTGLVTGANPDDRNSPQFKALQGFLENLSRTRVQQGFSSAETATFIFSFKQPLFTALRTEAGNDANLFADAIWSATRLLDELGLITVMTYQRAREEIINRQQQEMLELSTPVVKLWEGILALPMIGTLDSARTQVVMESLLHKIVETGSQLAIIDITGVPNRGHSGCPASAQDGHRHPADGRRLHHQWRAPTNCPDHRAPGRGPGGRDDQGEPGGCLGPCAQAHRQHAVALGSRWNEYPFCESASSCSRRFRSICTISSPCSCRMT